MLLRLFMSVVVGAVAIAPAAAAGRTGGTVVATVSGVAHLTAYRGVTAWSRAVGRQTRISYIRDGVVHDLRGSLPEANPDLGPSRDGRSVVLVVSRCGHEGCAVTNTDTRTGRTVRVHGLGGLHCSGLGSPSTWRGTIVVVGRHCGRDAGDGLFVRDRAGRARRLLRLASGSFSDTDVDRAHAVVSDSGDSSVRIVDLRTGVSRVVWQGEESASFSDAPRSPALDGGIVVWLENSGGIGLQFRQWLRTAAATVHPSKACARRQLPEVSTAVAVARRRLLYATADAVVRQAGTVHCETASG